MRKIKSLLSLAMVIVMLFSLVSCEKKVEENEAKVLVKNLVSESCKLNEILYGKGMEYEKSEDGKYSTIYSRVKDDAPFKTRKELEKEIKEVFTAAYANSLVSHAFTLTTGLFGENSYPRYQEGSDKVLTVMRDYQAREITQYNFDTIKIEKCRKNKIVATILSTENELVEIYLIREVNGWRLDSATV